jgi:hypothetical protein
MLRLEHAAKGDMCFFECQCGSEIEVVAGYDSDNYECDCGQHVCDDCRKVCDCCGEAIGCSNCFTNDSEAEDICNECLTTCDCGYKAGYKRFEKNDNGKRACPHCKREVE